MGDTSWIRVRCQLNATFVISDVWCTFFQFYKFYPVSHQAFSIQPYYLLEREPTNRQSGLLVQHKGLIPIAVPSVFRVGY